MNGEKPMSAREYYDLLVRCAYDGSFPSYRPYPEGEDPAAKLCMYRSPDGRRCAVGLLIPDERYTPGLEKRAVNCEAVREAVNGALPEVLTFHDLRLVQMCHDNAILYSDWKADQFVAQLNALPCFAGVIRKAV